MICGVGTDIVEVARMKRAFERWGEHFLRRLFTAGEIGYCFGRRDPFPHLAGRFAGKEAMIKALWSGGFLHHAAGAERTTLPFKDIEIGNGQAGQPFIKVPEEFLEDSVIAHITLAHEHCTAIATVVLERIGS